MPRPAIFLDRDGTITADTGYIYRIEEMEFLPNAIEGLGRLREMGWPFVVVSNQGGIGLGKFTEQHVHDFNLELARRLAACDITVLDWSFSPFHPRAVHPHFAGESDCRKPSPGMLLKAAERYDIDLAASWMIGDRGSDIEAGKRAGCRTILLKTGLIDKDMTPGLMPDFVADDLLAAAEIISKVYRPVR